MYAQPNEMLQHSKALSAQELQMMANQAPVPGGMKHTGGQPGGNGQTSAQAQYLAA